MVNVSTSEAKKTVTIELAPKLTVTMAKEIAQDLQRQLNTHLPIDVSTIPPMHIELSKE